MRPGSINFRKLQVSWPSSMIFQKFYFQRDDIIAFKIITSSYTELRFS
jgi:hypothetical protein